MASITGRARMIDSINALTGRDDCTEAVLVQERPSWTPWVLVVGVAAFGLVVGLVDGPILFGAIIGGLMGLAFAMVTTYWVVARAGNEVLLARSSRMSAKAIEIVERQPAPIELTVSKGLLQSKVSVFGHTMMTARQFVGRLETIAG